MVTDEIQAALTTLDDRLVSVLADGAIRLDAHNVAYLAQPPDFGDGPAAGAARRGLSER